MLQFTSVTNFACEIQPFVIIRSRNLKQIFVPPPSYCFAISKYSSFRTVTRFPLSATTQNILDRQTREQKHHDDAQFYILETHPNQQDKR
jgi:hypothetical protein